MILGHKSLNNNPNSQHNNHQESVSRRPPKYKLRYNNLLELSNYFPSVIECKYYLDRFENGNQHYPYTPHLHNLKHKYHHCNPLYSSQSEHYMILLVVIYCICNLYIHLNVNHYCYNIQHQRNLDYTF